MQTLPPLLLTLTLLLIRSTPTLSQPKLAPKCCDLSYRCIAARASEKGERLLGRKATRPKLKKCLRPASQSGWCVAQWTDGKFYCTSPGTFLQFIAGYRTSCRRGRWPSPRGRRADCPVDEGALDDVALPAPAPRCCDLSERCVYGLNDTAGDYEVGARASGSARVECAIESPTRCVAKYADDGRWYCTEPATFLEYLDGYRPHCRGRVFPSATAQRAECPVDEDDLPSVVGNPPAKDCCDLSRRCAAALRNTTGDYAVGRIISERKRGECTQEERGNWCVAKYSDKQWWCTSVGTFLEYLSGYEPQCPGDTFPRDGSTECPLSDDELAELE